MYSRRVKTGVRRWLIGVLAIGIALASVLLGSQRPKSPAIPASDGRQWVKLTFGLDEEVADWDGSVSAHGGAILNLESWGFERDHRLNAAARTWNCSTFVDNVRERSTFAEPLRGVLVELETAGKTLLSVKTKQGDFTVDVAKLTAGRPTRFIEERASAELLAGAQPLVGTGGWLPRLPQTHTDDDYPTMTVDGRGHRWIAWIAYDHEFSRDELRVLDLDAERAHITWIDAGRLQASPLLLTDGEGTLWLFWCAPCEENWEIYATRFNGQKWSKPERMTTANGSDLNLVGARGPNGQMWLAWQSFRHGNSDVIAKCRRDGAWTPDVAVTRDPSNQWEPSISIDNKGGAWIGYDSYQNGNYDVYLKSITIRDAGGVTVSEPIPIATSPDFEAHASVEASGNKVWVAYDAAGPNWGKDVAGSKTTYRGTYAEPLHATRRIELRAYGEGQVFKPLADVPQRLDTLRPTNVAHKYMGEVRRFYDLPQLVRDVDDRLWVFFRLNREGYAEDPQAAIWEIFATTYVDDAWLEPIQLPQSWGRQNQRAAFAKLDRGQVQTRIGAGSSQGDTGPASPPANSGLYCAWSRGHHMNDMPYRVFVGKLPSVVGSASDPPTTPFAIPDPGTRPEPIVKSWGIKRGGDEYHVYFGDLHRHTDISWCYPTIDGCPVDAFRYAMDAAGLDFLAITDHTRDTDPYPWWYTQKANDMFHVPGTFATIHGYERSNMTPGGGHRNVFFVKRDWPVFRSEHHYKHVGLPPPERLDPRAALYPKLRGKNAFTAAHTPAYSKGDALGTWSYNDPEVEPLVEIFQGFRRSYERPGKGVPEEASIWYALKRGYRLGFIASSDHVSTHMSYACVWAQDNSREALFEGMRARRTYAATDKILLDVRIGDALMGEETDIMGKPELDIRVLGTAAIDEIQVVRNAQVIWQSSPGQREIRTKYRDDAYPDGPAWYYVRVHQADEGMAWGSPIWVR